MSFDLSKWKKMKEEVSSGGDIEYMNLKVGNNIVRLLDSEPTMAKLHYIEDTSGKNRRIVCIGKGCPACELVEALYRSNSEDDRNLARKYRARNQFFFNVIDREDATADDGSVKVKVMQVGPQIFNQIATLVEDIDYGDPTKYDLKIKREGSGLNTQYSVLASRHLSDLTEDEAEAKKYDFEEMNAPKTPDEIREMLGLEAGKKDDFDSPVSKKGSESDGFDDPEDDEVPF